MLPLQREKHRCNKILTGRKGKDGRMRREGGAQGREGVRRGKGEGVGEGGTGLSDWFKRTCQASGHPAGLMGAVCSRRTRGPRAAPHAVLLNNAPIQVRARLLLSVAERWALLFRKARGLQFLCHLFAYSGHALKFLYKKHPPLQDWRHPPLE